MDASLQAQVTSRSYCECSQPSPVFSITTPVASGQASYGSSAIDSITAAEESKSFTIDRPVSPAYESSIASSLVEDSTLEAYKTTPVVLTFCGYHGPAIWPATVFGRTKKLQAAFFQEVGWTTEWLQKPKYKVSEEKLCRPQA